MRTKRAESCQKRSEDPNLLLKHVETRKTETLEFSPTISKQFVPNKKIYVITFLMCRINFGKFTFFEFRYFQLIPAPREQNHFLHLAITFRQKIVR